MDAQIDYLAAELNGRFAALKKRLKAPGISVETASDRVLLDFENPKDAQSKTTQRRSNAARALRAYRKKHP